MVTIAGLVGFFFSLFTAFFMEYLENSSQNPEHNERVNVLKRYSRFDREEYTGYVKHIMGKMKL